ncbi:MAG: hypothetical protein RL077_6460 [Verrucomicrobiota bacterium]|jgi:phosphate transport system substrate-binding protein
MDNLMTTWTRTFSALHPGRPARVVLHTRYSADAFDALLRGEVAVAPFARELFPAERARYLKKHGAPPLLVPVATGSRDTKGGTHAIAIFVHERNPLARLSLPQLREILARDGAITTWGQLGVGGEWAERKIAVHGMTVRRETGNPPGIVNFLEHRVLAGRAWRGNPTMVAHVDTIGGAQALEKIVRAVAADEFSLGYSGFAYAQPGTKTVALAETDGREAFTGTADEISRRDYPLTRTIYLCFDAAPSAVAKEFIRHALGREAQQAVETDAQKFFPLTVSAAESARNALP